MEGGFHQDIPVVGPPVAFGIGFLVLVLVAFSGGVADSPGTEAHEGGHMITSLTGRGVRRFELTGKDQRVDGLTARRANGRGPRTNGHAMDEAIWRNVSRAPWILARRLRGAGLELQWAGTAKTVRACPGEPAVRVAGPPGELLLYLFGRQGVAQVEVDGPAAAVEAVRRVRFGM